MKRGNQAPTKGLQARSWGERPSGDPMASGLWKDSHLVFRVKELGSLYYNIFCYPLLFSGVLNHEAWSRLCFGPRGKGPQEGRWRSSLREAKVKKVRASVRSWPGLALVLLPTVRKLSTENILLQLVPVLHKHMLNVSHCTLSLHKAMRKFFPEEAGLGPEEGCSLSNS